MSPAQLTLDPWVSLAVSSVMYQVCMAEDLRVIIDEVSRRIHKSIDVRSHGINSILLDLRAALSNITIFRIQNKATKLYSVFSSRKIHH